MIKSMQDYGTNRPLRIAFLTSEFISEKNSGGGLGNYLNRITQALKNIGHIPEIFVTTQEPTSSIIQFKGIRVERIAFSQSINLPTQYILRFSRRLPIFKDAPWSIEGYIKVALSLANSFKKRHQENPFNFIQSTNCHATGLLIKHLPNCPHLIRLSSKRDLWFEVDEHLGLGCSLLSYLEKLSLRHADIAYAPSEYLANACQDNWRKDVKVVRPPLFIDTEPSSELPPNLPERYFIHFGQLGKRKGSDILAKALCLVWQKEPQFKMVWAGKVLKIGEYETCHQLWGSFATNVLWLGALEKSILYAVLQKAEVAVLPSRVDNLPNTVIESLMFNVPVIGSKGASIDELVESGVNGELVEIGNVEQLAEMILKAWRKEINWPTNPLPKPKIFEELDPLIAAKNLIHLAGYTV